MFGLLIGVKPIPYLKKNKIYDVANSNEWKIVDIRPKHEFQEMRIATSINLPLLSLEKKIDSYVDRKQDKILLVCWNGHRGSILTRKLYANGYNVKLLKGGLNGLHKTKWADLVYIED